jgi:hypothetical protein
MRWAAYVARMVKQGIHGSGTELEERDHLKDLGVDRSIILEWLVKIGWEDAKWTDLTHYWDK